MLFQSAREDGLYTTGEKALTLQQGGHKVLF